MKQKILIVLMGLMLAVSGCSNGGTKNPEKLPTENGETDNPAEDDEKILAEKQVTIYYVDEATGEVTTTEVSIPGDLSEGILTKLKEEQLLSTECSVQDILVSEEEQKIEIDINEGFGNYIRSMGATGSEQIIECVVKSYLGAYGCKELKITENGSPLDTGHTVLDGYISY